MTTERHQAWNERGELVEDRVVVVPDPPADPRLTRIETIRAATTVAGLRTALLEYLEAEVARKPVR